MVYGSYYVLSILLAYALQNPWAAVLALVFYLCRCFLPDPVVWIRTMGRIWKLEGDIVPLVAAIAIAPEVGRGDPYMLAAEALMKLGRWEEAEDALERFLEYNQSTVKAYVQLARVRRKQTNDDGSNEAITQGKDTWSVLPSFKRRHEWPWYLAAVASPLWL